MGTPVPSAPVVRPHVTGGAQTIRFSPRAYSSARPSWMNRLVSAVAQAPAPSEKRTARAGFVASTDAVETLIEMALNGTREKTQKPSLFVVVSRTKSSVPASWASVVSSVWVVVALTHWPAFHSPFGSRTPMPATIVAAARLWSAHLPSAPPPEYNLYVDGT